MDHSHDVRWELTVLSSPLESGMLCSFSCLCGYLSVFCLVHVLRGPVCFSIFGFPECIRHLNQPSPGDGVWLREVWFCIHVPGARDPLGLGLGLPSSNWHGPGQSTYIFLCFRGMKAFAWGACSSGSSFPECHCPRCCSTVQAIFLCQRFVLSTKTHSWAWQN